MRENTEGEYSSVGGRMFEGSDNEMAIQESIFTRRGVDRILQFAFEQARSRPRKSLTAATKSNGISITMPYWDERLAEMAKRYPDVPFILAHCMTRAPAQVAREVLTRHANLYCDTSYRSTARNAAPMLRPHMIHTAEGTDSAWLAVIEALPDRFMVGTDIYTQDVSYDAVIGAIRSGLLAKLSPTTLKKVAHENAQRVFRLPALQP